MSADPIATAEILAAARARRALALRVDRSPDPGPAEPVRVRWRPSPAEVAAIRNAAVAHAGQPLGRLTLQTTPSSWRELRCKGVELAPGEGVRLSVLNRLAERASLAELQLQVDDGRLVAIVPAQDEPEQAEPQARAA